MNHFTSSQPPPEQPSHQQLAEDFVETVLNLPYKQRCALDYAGLNLYGNSSPPEKIDTYFLSVSSSPLNLSSAASIYKSSRPSATPASKSKKTNSPKPPMSDHLSIIDHLSDGVRAIYGPPTTTKKQPGSIKRAANTDDAQEAVKFVKQNKNAISKDPKISRLPSEQDYIVVGASDNTSNNTPVLIDSNVTQEIARNVANADRECLSRLKNLGDDLMVDLTVFSSQRLIENKAVLGKKFYPYLVHPLGGDINSTEDIAKWNESRLSSSSTGRAIPESAPRFLQSQSKTTRELVLAFFLSFCHRSLDSPESMQTIIGTDDKILTRYSLTSEGYKISEVVIGKPPQEKKYKIMSLGHDHMVFFEDESVKSGKNRWEPMHVMSGKSMESLVKEGFTAENGLADLELTIGDYASMFFQLICFISDLNLSNPTGERLHYDNSLFTLLSAAFGENGTLSEKRVLELRKDLNSSTSSKAPTPLKPQQICERLETLLLGSAGKRDAFSSLLGTFQSEKIKPRSSTINSVTIESAMEALRCTVHLGLLANTAFRMERFQRQKNSAPEKKQ